MNHLDAVTMSDNTRWTWNVVPMLAGALVLSILFFPQGNLPADDATAQAMHAEASTVAMVIVLSPQPGAGEPELVPAELPQSY